MTGWFQDSTPLAILGVAAGAIIGWPFSVLIGYGCKLKGMFENVFSREKIVPTFRNIACAHLLYRVPIAFDLLVLKRQWKSFITWSVVALLLLLVRTFF